MKIKTHPDLGAIPEHWDIAEIGDVADVTKLAGYEFTKHIKYIEDGEIIALRSLNVVDGQLDISNIKRIAKSVSDELPRSKLFKNDLLLTYTGSKLGDTALIDENDKYHLAPNVCRLRANEDNDAYYLYLFLRSKIFANLLDNYKVGSGQPTVPMKNIRKIPLPWPPKDERKKIGDIYSSLNNKVEVNRQINQTLEQIAQAIFKSWFVDFEPVKAKIEAKLNGQDPERAAMRAISGKTDEELDQLSPDQRQQLTTAAALFPDELEDSELGEIPKGWDVVPVNEHIDILNGFAFKSKDYSEKGTFVLRTKNFNADRIVKRLSDDVFLPDEFLTSHKKYLCEPYDYHLIMVGASVGNRGLIYPHLLPALRNQNMWCFRVKPKSYIKQVFVKYMLDSIVERSMGLASGSAREFFRKGDFGKQNICSGSESIQTAFFNYVLPIMEQQSNLDNEQDILSDIRDSLLPKLLSGEISLDDTKHTAEAVA